MVSTLGPFGIVGVGLIGSAFDVAFCETFFVRSFSAYYLLLSKYYYYDDYCLHIICLLIACLLAIAYLLAVKK